MKREQATELADAALEELRCSLAAGKSQRLLQLLDFFGRFHKYSWNNSLLIHRQMPDATYVAGFRKWRELGRFVRKGNRASASSRR